MITMLLVMALARVTFQGLNKNRTYPGPHFSRCRVFVIFWRCGQDWSYNFFDVPHVHVRRTRTVL